jgi:hypothetical protein
LPDVTDCENRQYHLFRVSKNNATSS